MKKYIRIVLNVCLICCIMLNIFMSSTYAVDKHLGETEEETTTGTSGGSTSRKYYRGNNK